MSVPSLDNSLSTFNTVQKVPTEERDRPKIKNTDDTIKSDSVNLSSVNNDDLTAENIVEKNKIAALDKEQKLKRKFSYYNMGASVFLSSMKALANKDSIDTIRFTANDVFSNVGMAEFEVRNPEINSKNFAQSIKETTFHVASTFSIPFFLWAFGKNPMTALGAALTTNLISEVGGHILGKAATTPKKLTKEEQQKQRANVNRIHMAALLAVALKTNNLMKSMSEKPDDYNYHGTLWATLLNTLKSSIITEIKHQTGNRVKPSEEASRIFFDGAVSGAVVRNVRDFAGNKFGLENNVSNIIWQTLISGPISVAGIVGASKLFGALSGGLEEKIENQTASQLKDILEQKQPNAKETQNNSIALAQ